MSIFNLLAEAAETENTNSSGGWLIWVLFGVLIVVMIVPSFLRSKKERKAYEEKMSQMDIGCTVKTIGLIIGEIIAMTEDTVTIKTGNEENYSYITVEKRAVYEILPSDTPTVDQPISDNDVFVGDDTADQSLDAEVNSDVQNENE